MNSSSSKRNYFVVLTSGPFWRNILRQWSFDKILLPGRLSVKILACIPARYGSTRFAGKVLAKDTGKFLIQHTYEQACLAKLPDKVIIAADDKRIADAADTFGAECILTSPEHKSGTDRIAEAVKRIEDRGQKTEDRRQRTEDRGQKNNEIRFTLNANDIVVNLQADEPEIDPENIDFLAQLLIKNPDYKMATLAADFQTPEQVANPDIVKVITDCDSKAIYFSRAPIPYDRESSGVGEIRQYLRHIGIYAYRKQFLLKITALPQTKSEKIEKLEQLRVIELGFPILVGKVAHTCAGIDTPDQYADFVKRQKSK